MDNNSPSLDAVNVEPLQTINAGNSEFIEKMYEAYKRDRSSVDPQWALFFAGFELGNYGRNGSVNGNGNGVATTKAGRVEIPVEAAPSSGPTAGVAQQVQIADLIHSYRELGHLIANLDPLGHNITQHPLLDLGEFGLKPEDLDKPAHTGNFRGLRQGTLRELMQALRTTYCDTFAVEYMEIRDPAQRGWLQDQMEPTLNKPALNTTARKHVLQRLIAAEEFEHFFDTRYVGKKRFSNEGGETLITLLDEMIEYGTNLSVNEMIFGMAHRGRLNVLTHILKKPYELIMSEFEERPAYKFSGDGDVKYHLGYATDYITKAGKKIHLSLSANPSHLEVVDPIVEGMVRAKQNRRGDLSREQVVPILIHGDAAFTGQGIVAETLYLSELEAYRTGGTVHIIVNNQIGFTTNPSDLRFTRYPSDVSKAIQAPVFHVNADDPEAVVHAARLAIGFRQRFKTDVIIDLVCYRRQGHNEQEDPSVTQPVMYREIRSHATVRQLYEKRLLARADVTQSDLDAMKKGVVQNLETAMEHAKAFKPSDTPPPTHGPWANFTRVPKDYKDWAVKTAVEKKLLKDIGIKLCTDFPAGFTPHRVVAKIMQTRLGMIESEQGIDWGCGEMLALGSLLNEGTWVRFTGQDAARGTFSHRHAVLYDNQNGRPFVPLANFAEGRSRFMIVNTMLSELAVLGFEYGFASADPETLVIWEAQFGDFVNGAQTIIDQYLVSAESKWGKFNGLVMLLPHGYEGQGPEHSHARLERFLQLAAEDNVQVCNPTTPAQYFHLLRRQMRRTFRKPLVVMSPKSLLRKKEATSTLDEFANGTFQDIIDEVDPLDRSRVKRVVMCSGKIYYELTAERQKRNITDIAILRLEQIYPFAADRLQEISKTYPREVEVVWVQEEPRNNGVYPFIGAKFHYYWAGMKKLWYVGRKPSASPAAGSFRQHNAEQADIINKALTFGSAVARVGEQRTVEMRTDGSKEMAK